MRINKFVAQATGMSRRAADDVVAQGRVTRNGKVVAAGYDVSATDSIVLDDTLLAPPPSTQTILLNKPPGYVCSRDGQGSKTVYELLPTSLHHLKTVGRLDKYSSGIILLTNDGQLAHELTHPSRQKIKVYEVKLNIPLAPLHQQMISDYGVQLEDGPSRFTIERQESGYIVTMHEGRNRQIRRTFAALGYTVTSLHRTQFGPYTLEGTKLGSYTTLQ